jgi:hypothetical protein
MLTFKPVEMKEIFNSTGFFLLMSYMLIDNI